VVEAQRLAKRFDDLEVFREVDLMIARQDKVALVGKNGAGKTTLTRILLGELEGEGTCGLGHNVDVGYYAQNQSDELDGELTVFETIDNEATGDVRKRVRALLGSFLFSGEDVDKRVKVLSGGEKARLALCKLMLHPYNLLVLDEPTNHLDMKAKDVLKQALMHYDGTLIVVSHDRDFLTGLTELVYEVTPTGLRQYIGDIQQFLLEKRSDTIAAYEAGRSNGPGGNPGGKDTQAKIKTSEKASAKGDRKQAYENQKLAKKLKNRINKREKEIAEFEAKEATLNEEMSALDPTDSMATVAKAKEFETVQRDLQKALDDWEAATSELEALHNLD
jgi:ATP-binding cassette subfamily F protein 3